MTPLYWLHLHGLEEVLDKFCLLLALVPNDEHHLSLKGAVVFKHAHQHVYITLGRLLGQPLLQLVLVVLVELQGPEVYDGIFYAYLTVLKYLIIFS